MGVENGRRARRLGALGGSALLGAATLGASADDADAKNLVVKNTKASGKGSLKNMVRKANRTARKDRIVFRSKLSGAIDLARRLRVTEPLKIDGRGGGQRIEAGGDGGKIVIDEADKVALEKLELDNVTLRTDTTYLRVRESTMSGDGDGVAVYTGGYYPAGTTIADSTIDGFASGVNLGYPQGKVVRSTISGMTKGPGVTQATRAEGMTIRKSTVTGNAGSGVAVEYYGRGRIESSTISGNDGSGVYAGAPAYVLDSTITGNGDGGVSGSYWTGIANSIVAGNGGPGTVPGGDGTFPGGADCSASEAISSGGGNVFGDGTGCNAGDDDLVGVDPDLLPLDDNGGPTATHALSDTSPALGNAERDGYDRDQRGVPRGRKRDSGAFELAFCGPNRVNVVGTNGRDRLKGTRGDDGILALRGRDRLLGGLGDDALCGSAGRDRLKGGRGDDWLNGGRGKDLCRGGKGDDTARRCERERGVAG